jgi:hypothetical protein
MEDEVVVDVGALRRKLDEAEKLKSEEKLVAMRKLYGEIAKAEADCAMDLAIPWGVVSELRELIPQVQSSINRLTAAKKKRREKALESN